MISGRRVRVRQGSGVISGAKDQRCQKSISCFQKLQCLHSDNSYLVKYLVWSTLYHSSEIPQTNRQPLQHQTYSTTYRVCHVSSLSMYLRRRAAGQTVNLALGEPTVVSPPCRFLQREVPAHREHGMLGDESEDGPNAGGDTSGKTFNALEKCIKVCSSMYGLGEASPMMRWPFKL